LTVVFIGFRLPGLKAMLEAGRFLVLLMSRLVG
jgi:hypothetical protein